MTTRPASACVSDAQPRPDSNLEPGSLANELNFAWKSGVWVRLPWQGLGSLVLVVLFETIVTGASAGIVALSHDSPIDKWRVGSIEVQPQVWLAVFSTIINALLGFALTMGVNIHFWKRAGRGMTLRELHDIYESTAILGAAKTLLPRSWNLVVIVCIIVTVCMARDPFFQRASVVENVQRVVADAVDIRSALFVPYGFFKLELSNPHLSLDLKHALLNMFVDAIPYDVGNIPCADGCKSFLKGFGFEAVCESQSYDYNISDALIASHIQPAECRGFGGYHDVIDDTWQNINPCSELGYSFGDGPKMTAYDVEYDVFEYDDVEHEVREYDFVIDGRISNKPGEIRVTTKFKDMPTCEGVAQIRTCTLHQGVVEYAVVLQNSTISLQYPHWQNDTILYKYGRQNQSYITQWLEAFSTLNPAYKYDLRHMLSKGDIMSEDYVNCNAWGDRPASNMSCSFSSSLCDSGFTFRYRDRFQNKGIILSPCKRTWRDPIQDILDDIRNFAFRVSLIAAPLTDYGGNSTDWVARTSNWTQRVEFHDGIKLQTVYRAKWSFFAAAVTISLVGVLSVASLFWGWWELGRSVSLNRLEVGMAFDSPILRIVNSNSRRSQIVQTMGPRQVKYGGQVLKELESALMNESALVNETALMSESASVNESALMSESAFVNESASTGESEPIDFSKQLPRLRMELNESDYKDWVITPKPGDVFC